MRNGYANAKTKSKRHSFLNNTKIAGKIDLADFAYLFGKKKFL